ncbi:hypothetical protein GBZ48_03455 [Azospirillum melinis]|uniref:Uncharacterized protein n=1 Tax=Azospirillum melinis TaxID=328839 RepID=A0ABX2K452_9PROT|nr:hypothetical protein [Azospirillum melinis]MBP2303968.1 hypothetical protein [Azospirillum melinis]NUA98336.1 hypothetical protein [Azospirillum melinis]
MASDELVTGSEKTNPVPVTDSSDSEQRVSSKKVRGAFYVCRNPDDKRDICFQRSAQFDGDIPDDQDELRNSIESTLTVMKIIFSDNDEKFEEYFRSLLSLAQAGLVGDAPQTKISARALIGLRNDIVVRESEFIRNRYLKSLGIIGVVLFSVIAMVEIYVIRLYFLDARGYGVIWCGSIIGVWLSFSAKRIKISFDDLSFLEQSGWNPFNRLIFVGLLAVSFGILLSLQILDVQLGSIKASSFKDNIEAAVIIGILGGFSEKALPLRITEQASKMFGSA